MKAPPLAERERPGLTVTLTGPRDLEHCHSCGRPGTLEAGERDELLRWIECDPWDRHDHASPIVVLCPPCGSRLIEPHPRLYVQLLPCEPRAGAIPLCIGCRHLDGVRCASPLARINGGPGMSIKAPKPMMAHVCRSPRSQSGFVKLYRAWPRECTGRETLDLVPNA